MIQCAIPEKQKISQKHSPLAVKGTNEDREFIEKGSKGRAKGKGERVVDLEF